MRPARGFLRKEIIGSRESDRRIFGDMAGARNPTNRAVAVKNVHTLIQMRAWYNGCLVGRRTVQTRVGRDALVASDQRVPARTRAQSTPRGIIADSIGWNELMRPIGNFRYPSKKRFRHAIAITTRPPLGVVGWEQVLVIPDTGT